MENAENLFSAGDWAVLVLYLAATLLIGLWASRGNGTFREYMIGGGTMPWVAVGVSLIATSVSATTFLGAPADVFGADMTFLMFQFGALVSIFVVGALFIPRFAGSGATSAYGLLERTFSRPVRRLAAAFYALHLLLRTGILLFGPSLVLSAMLGVSVESAILVTAVVAVFYTWHGGFKAVIWTDVMQFSVFFLGGILVLWIVAGRTGGWAEMAAAASAAGKTRWFVASLDPTDARTLLSAGVAYAFLEIAIRGCDQQFVQRYLSCRDVKAANRSSVLSMVLGVLVSVLFYWVGAALYVFYRVKEAAPLPESVGINQVFPFFIVHALPAGVRGAIVAAIYAAAMSSLSGAINSLANTAENDLLCSPEEDPGRLRRAKRWTALWGALGVVAAFVAASQQGSLLKSALFFTGLFTGPLLGLFLFAFWRPKTRPSSLIAGLFGGMAALTLFTPPPFSWAWKSAYPLAWTWNPLISLCGMALVVLAVDKARDLLGKPGAGGKRSADGGRA